MTLTGHGAFNQEPFSETFSKYCPSLGREAELLSPDAGLVHQADGTVPKQSERAGFGDAFSGKIGGVAPVS